MCSISVQSNQEPVLIRIFDLGGQRAWGVRGGRAWPAQTATRSDPGSNIPTISTRYLPETGTAVVRHRDQYQEKGHTSTEEGVAVQLLDVVVDAQLALVHLVRVPHEPGSSIAHRQYRRPRSSIAHAQYCTPRSSIVHAQYCTPRSSVVSQYHMTLVQQRSLRISTGLRCVSTGHTVGPLQHKPMSQYKTARSRHLHDVRVPAPTCAVAQYRAPRSKHVGRYPPYAQVSTGTERKAHVSKSFSRP
eukprot:2231851-Rhodomonas_salina.2